MPYAHFLVISSLQVEVICQFMSVYDYIISCFSVTLTRREESQLESEQQNFVLAFKTQKLLANSSFCDKIRLSSDFFSVPLGFLGSKYIYDLLPCITGVGSMVFQRLSLFELWNFIRGPTALKAYSVFFFLAEGRHKYLILKH